MHFPFDFLSRHFVSELRRIDKSMGHKERDGVDALFLDCGALAQTALQEGLDDT